MSAEFYTILLPPQTLESLDNWGSLDRLPLSLDDSAWAAAGIYGLTIADGAQTSGRMEGSRQTVIPLAPAEAFTGEGLGESLRIRTDSLTGKASTGGGLSALRIRNEAGEIQAETGQGTTFQRIRQDALTSGALVSENWCPLRVRLLSGSLTASVLFGSSAEFVRIRDGVGTASALAGNSAVDGGRIRPLSGPLAGTSSQSAAWSRIRQASAAGLAHGFGVFDPVRILHLKEAEPGVSGEVFEGRRIRLAGGVLSAESGSSVLAIRIRQSVAHGLAESAESVAALRVRLGGVSTGAVAAASAEWRRIRTSWLSASAELGGSLFPTLLGNDRLFGWAYSGGGAEGLRTRTAAGALSASSGGAAAALRLRTAELAGLASASGKLDAEAGPQLKGSASAGGSLAGYVLGHGWEGGEAAQGGAWEQEILVPEPWQGLAENSAEWAQNSEQTQGWNRLEGHSGKWVKHEESSAGIWELGAGRGPAEWSASAGSPERDPGKAWVQAHEKPATDAVSGTRWAGIGSGEPASWRRLADVGGNGWRAVRS